MHSRNRGNPAPVESETCASGARLGNGLSSGAPGADSSVRPFVERRRQRPTDHTWHDALGSVQRLLVHYEQTNRLLTEEEESYRSLFENALIGIFRIGLDGAPMIVNRSVARTFGYDSAVDLLADAPNLGEAMVGGTAEWHEFVRTLEARGSQSAVEAEAYLRDGERKWVELNVRAVAEDGIVVHFEGTVEDITERKISEERIRLLAYYDPVTGLPNRPLFEERLEEALSAARWKSQRVALLVLELGRFKVINDSLGREFGDGLLRDVAERIRVTAGPEATVARVGGAEFAIILEDVGGVRDVERKAERLLEVLTGEFSLGGSSVNITGTMGISMFPLHGWDGPMLVERADVAMYSAKELGPNEFQFFNEEMNNRIRERLILENDLRLALERNELFLVYQVQVDLRTGAVTGLEALLRWQHPEKGLVPPAEFIGVAEGSGLIIPIGEWVLRTACSQARKWQDAGLPAVPVAVNVSAIQFRQPAFCAMVRRVLEETGLEAKYLELELTEGLLLTNSDVMFQHMEELREMGLKLAIDDFGTGYSSLGYLRQFKVHRLKIDRSFVREVSVNADDAAIATAIIKMARALNLDVLAEGVENAEQLNFLREQNCYEIQGYYFSRPVSVDQIENQLRNNFAH